MHAIKRENDSYIERNKNKIYDLQKFCNSSVIIVTLRFPNPWQFH